jgi:DNA-binding SARP family transcriptional activator/tetratricopeptide (TPR) repeat protein
MLEIRALGNLELALDGEVLESLSLRGQVLLVYLGLEGGRHHRNYLASMLWPESSEVKAQTSLRVLLTELRRFAPDCLEINRTDLGINPESGLYLDVHEFESLLKAGEAKSAYHLYRGDLLSGVYIPGSVEFENWRRWENERIRLLATRQGENHILKEFARGNYQEVELFTQDLMKIDPSNEIANQYFAISRAVRGYRPAALKHIQEYEAYLEEDLGIGLSPEIIRVQNIISEGNLDALIESLRPRQNLPSIPTSFIGRTAELRTITKLISDPECRLISIVGPGGIGKTRLAIKAANAAILDFPDGSFFVPLDPITSGDDIIPAIANSLHFRFGTVATELDPEIQLLDFLWTRTLLLILDGFEHLTDSADQLTNLLNCAPSIQLLVTSRHRLNLPEEWMFALEGLAIHPNDTDHGKLPDALALFSARMEQILPHKVLSADESKQAARICSLVEGMPLGIELAATWTPMLGLSEIADEIADNFGFLKDHHPGNSSKHNSMKAVFQSSWNLLKENQQEIVLRLSVFRGGFSRQAAQEISRASISDLAILMDRSLLRKNTTAQFELHPIVRQFCREIIVKQVNTWHDIQYRHYLYYSEYLTARVQNLFSLESDNTRPEVHDAITNILAAARFYLQQAESAPAPDIIQNLFSYYLIRGWHEGKIVFHQFSEILVGENQQKGGISLLLLARVQAQEAFFLSNLGLEEESEQLCRTSLPILQGSDHIRELAICLNNLGINAMYRGDYELSLSYLEQAILLGQEPNCYSLPSYYLWVGYVYFLIGEYKLGMNSLQESLEYFEKQNNQWGRAFALDKIGLACDGMENYQDAMQYHHQALAIFKQTGDSSGQGYSLSRMSLGALLIGDYQAALQYGQEGLEQFMDVGHRWGICASTCRIGYARLGLGDLIQAESTLRKALEISYQNRLDPLSLHVLGGFAVLKLLSGCQSEAIELLRYVIEQPKTPEIYKDLLRIWFDLDLTNQPSKGSGKNHPKLDTIVQEILSSQ